MSMPVQKPGRSKQDYATPADFMEAVTERLGIVEFDIDLAADDSNHKAAYWLDEEDDALALDWAPLLLNMDGTCTTWAWLNPPYSEIGPWAFKCLQTCHSGGAIAFLVPASVGSNWYRDYIHNQQGVEVLFLNGRLCFIDNWQTVLNEDGTRKSPSKPLYPKDCLLVLFHGDDRPFTADIWTWCNHAS